MTEYKFESGCSKYGADMGRRDEHADDRASVVGRMRLFRVRLGDSGGCYDNGGAYWGAGEPLWCALHETEFMYDVRFCFRAPDRAAAVRKVREAGYVNARFYGPREQ